MIKIKTLRSCLKKDSEYEDFLNDKSINSLIIFVYKISEIEVDLRIYYFQKGKIRYVSSTFFKLHNVGNILEKSGFTFLTRTYSHFGKDGNFNENIFKVNNIGKNQIVELSKDVMDLSKRCFALKKKSGRPKKNQKIAPKPKKKKKNISVRKIHSVMKKINKSGKKRKRTERVDVDDEGDERPRKKIKFMFKGLESNEQLEFLKYGINNLKNKREFIMNQSKNLNQQDKLKLAHEIVKKLSIKEAKEFFDDLIQNEILLKNYTKFAEIEKIFLDGKKIKDFIKD
jgi:hypothetical protein